MSPGFSLAAAFAAWPFFNGRSRRPGPGLFQPCLILRTTLSVFFSFTRSMAS
jgi:hypothetical protein